MSFRNIFNAFKYLRSEGFLSTFSRTVEFLNQVFLKDKLYNKWIDQTELHSSFNNDSVHLRVKNIKISLIVPVYNTNIRYLKEMLSSVVNQSYPNWELCIADGGSREDVRELLESWMLKDQRIKVEFLGTNLGIAGNSNAGIIMATGDYVAFLDHDDTLAPCALFEIVRSVTMHPDSDFIYSDEDKLSEDGRRRFYPHFKPDFSPDMLRSCNYICHFTAIKRSLLDEVGLFRKGFEGSQDYDLFLRSTEKAKQVVHIPKILYHWRASKNSTSINRSSKNYASESGIKALSEHINRIGLKASVKGGFVLNTFKISYHFPQEKVSIIIPNRDHYDDLSRCIRSICDKSSYANYEIIVVDNGSVQRKLLDYYEHISRDDRIKIATWNQKFNYSELNNYGALHAVGSYLLFLNNDTVVINTDWIERMLEHACRPGVGAVGAKLYYPDGSIQHAGIILGIGGVAGHSHEFYSGKASGYMDRLKIVQNLSAVTGACMMIPKAIYKQVNGFDEAYQVAYGDVDLCLKLRKLGYLVVWTPYAELYHFESKSRGPEDTPEKLERFINEIMLFNTKWADVAINCDPYYNPNLTKLRKDFSINLS